MARWSLSLLDRLDISNLLRLQGHLYGVKLIDADLYQSLSIVHRISGGAAGISASDRSTNTLYPVLPTLRELASR